MSAANLCCETVSKIDTVIGQKGKTPDSLIEILHGVQEDLGYLPPDVLEYIAQELRIPPGQVESVVTFYSFFTMTPRGRHTVKVCQGTACYVRGGKQLLEAAEKACHCGVGETSEDLRFSLAIVRCVGACGLSPVLTVNDEVHERVKPTKLAAVLSRYE